MFDRASFLRRSAATALAGHADPAGARAAAPPVLPREDDLGLDDDALASPEAVGALEPSS